MRNRFYSLIVPWFADGAMAFMQRAMPLLAVQLGVGPGLLGIMGASGQIVRLPLTLISGNLSEKVGRATVIVPAAVIIAAAAVGLGFTHTPAGILLFYAIGLGAFGVFYPPLQALIGDVSHPKRLRKNLGAFGIGWCVGGAMAGLTAGWLVKRGLPLTFFFGAGYVLVAGALALVWSRTTRPYVPNPSENEAEQTVDQTGWMSPGKLLVISRMGLVTGVFGVAAVGILFTPVAINILHWSKAETATIGSMAMVGQAVSVLSTYASAWWRGKLWPQIAAQSVLLACGIVICLASSKLILALAFLGVGLAHGIAYTAALYHGLMTGPSKGRQGGMHECIVSCGHIAGNILGGLVAQRIAPRAPFAMLSVLAVLCLIATMTVTLYGRRRPSGV